MVFTTSLCVKVHLYDYNNTIFTTFNINTSYFAVSRRSGTLQSGSSLKTTLEIDRIIANLLYLCISEISQCMSLTKFIANIAKLSPSTIWRLRHFVHFHNFVKLNSDFEDIPDLWTYVIRASIENKNNAQILVSGTVFPGVRVMISEVSMAIQSEVKYCRFVKRGGDVKMEPY